MEGDSTEGMSAEGLPGDGSGSVIIGRRGRARGTGVQIQADLKAMAGSLT